MQKEYMHYPKDGEYPEINEIVQGFFEDNEVGLTKMLPGEKDESVWFIKYGNEWISCDEPIFWKTVDG